MGVVKRFKKALIRYEVQRLRLKPHAVTNPVRKRMVFYGKVQHVGFRYEAVCIARDLSLTGFALNRPSGAVEIEVQGDVSGVVAFNRTIQAVPRFHISDMTEEVIPLKEGELTFYQVAD